MEVRPGSGRKQLKGLELLLALALVLVSAPAHPATSDVKSKYREIKRQIQDKKEKLQEAEKIESVTLGQMHLTNRKLQKVRNNLRRYRKLLEDATLNIEKAQLEADDLEQGIKERRNRLRRKLRAMNRFGKHGDLLLAVGASGDVPAAMRRWKYLESLSVHEHEALEKFKADLIVLQKKKKKLARLIEGYEEQEKKIQKAERSLEREMYKKKLMLSSVRKDKKTYERLLRELRKASARMQKIIRQSERKRSSTYAGADFRRRKGILPWPTDGKVAIPYGSQKDPRFNTPVFRNGIYIETEEEDALANAVDRGKVVFADWFEGYGLLVIINHGRGYHTLYGNLDEIFVRTGDIINTKEAVGRIGMSGVTASTSLYFEVRYKGKPLDPSGWLR